MISTKLLRFSALVGSILLLINLCGCEFSEDETFPKATELYVNDFATVIAAGDADIIRTKGKALEDATTAQVTAVTVDNLMGKEISEYATEIGREWGVGAKDADNGVVILLSVEDREVFVAIGTRLEGDLPDSATGRLIDNYAIPYFRDNRFSEGMVALYTAVANEVALSYNTTLDENYTSVNQLPDHSDNEIKKVALSWVFLIIFVILYLLIFRRRGRRNGFWFGGPPFFGGGFGSGGFGGSGRSGGGFGGFGGGGFSGGGAGRGF